MRDATASRSGCSTTGWPTSAASPGTRPGRARRRCARSRLVPREPRVRSARRSSRPLAQLCMLDGIFSDAQRLARDAIRVARACDPVARDQEIHATTTLAVALAWGRDPNAAIELLREADDAARAIDDSDALFRISANLTTVLDLVGRRAEAVDVAYRGIDDARRAGLEAVYGNFLAGNVTESLILLGRWDEARALSKRALTWLPVGVVFLTTMVEIAVIEIETEAGAASGRASSARRSSSSMRCASRSSPVRTTSRPPRTRSGAATSPMPAGRWIVAGPSSGRPRSGCWRPGWRPWSPRWTRRPAPRRTSDASWRRSRRRGPARRRSCRRRSDLVEAGGAPPTTGSRRVAEAYLATARGFQRRLEGDDDPAVWAKVATDVAGARPRHTRWRSRAGARPRRSWRATPAAPAGRVARKPLLESAALAVALEARPLLRNLRDLAGRARIELPDGRRRVLGDCDGTAGSSSRRRRSRRSRRRRARPATAAPTSSGRSSAIRPRGPAAGHVRAERPRAGGARPGGPGTDEPGDRRAAVHQPEDGRRPRREHPGQAGGLGPRRGRHRGDPAGPDRSAGVSRVGEPGSMSRTPRDPEGGSPGLLVRRSPDPDELRVRQRNEAAR